MQEYLKENKNYWLIGVNWNTKAEINRFLDEGFWENTHKFEYINQINSINLNDRIILKKIFVPKKDIPFNDNGNRVSAMEIHAIGTVKENTKNGKYIKVDWQKFPEPRIWYLYAFSFPICKLKSDDWKAQALIDFAFKGKEQDIDSFRNDDYWHKRFGGAATKKNAENKKDSSTDIVPNTDNAYTIDTIIKKGCFIEKNNLENILTCLKDTKNLILQGPPGTGKTWLAKRLAYALIGKEDDTQICAIQFHPNISYEDFIRGYRPSIHENGKGELSLIDGPFLQMVATALENPSQKYVMVIEEINRGNPSSVFGEMLTLIENNKRDKKNALQLSYQKHHNERIHVPENLYIIGTMNQADKSLALLDYAFRRRFAFITLAPIYGKNWQNYMHEYCNIDKAKLKNIAYKMNALNDKISKDVNLGYHYAVGHSYLTSDRVIENVEEWYKNIINSAIKPLLQEYYFDDTKTVKKIIDDLKINLKKINSNDGEENA